MWNGRFLLALVVSILISVSCSPDSDKHGSEDQTFHGTYTNFSSEIILETYTTIQKDGHSFMMLTWRTPYDRPRDSYTLFVHAIDQDGNVLFQFDHELLDRAGKSTVFWDRGPVKDVFQLTPPAGHAPGKYTIRLGPYVKETGRFLEVFATDLARPMDDFWKGRAVLLHGINCR